MAMVFALGFYTKRMKLAYSIYGVMLCAYLAGVGINVYQEMNGNPRIDDMGIAQDNGSMEGKEVRLGAGATALWSITTTVTSNGSVNGMHDSTMPLSGMMEMLNMQINTWFGGVGVGWMNYYTFIIIAVFISGLMVGRTPENSRKESGSPGDENSDNRCAASSVCDIGRHGSVLLSPCAPSGVCRE